MQNQTIIILLIVAIIVSKIIIGILIYVLIRKNRILKQEKLKLQETNVKLNEQGEQILSYNEELKASELFKTKVLSIASHDLRAPFASMDMLLHMEDLSQMTKPELQQILAAVGNQVSISTNMLNEVLLWAESQLRDNLENEVNFSILEEIDTILFLFEHNVKSKNMLIHHSGPTNLNAYMSRDIFCFVLRNIISNAIKFSPEGEAIKIETIFTQHSEIQIRIENRADSISNDLIANLNTRNSWEYKKTVNHNGTGLGISLCKDLIQRIGGKLHFENQNFGFLTAVISLPKDTKSFNHIKRKHQYH